MSRTTKFCRNCEKNNNPPKCPGFLVGWEDTEIRECPFCKNKELITYDISDDEILLLGNISADNYFIEAMITLKEKDPIEYQLKMSQFKNQVQQQKQTAQLKQEQSKPCCPYCHSTNTHKISGLSKVGSVVLWGVFAMGKTSKQWHCNNCKSDF